MYPRLTLTIVWLFIGTACQNNAVVFAPTPAPEDKSPLLYTHPGGAFTVNIPREWSVFTQNTAQLASAAFSPPDSAQPIADFSVLNWQNETIQLIDAINAYQNEIRPDLDRYTEQDRQIMPDGSWRLTGLRLSEGGIAKEINTFIERSNNLMSIINMVLPDEDFSIADYEAILNSFSINPNANLQPTSLGIFGTIAQANLTAINIKSWSTEEGVYFITGEVVNNGFLTETNVQVRTILETDDGTGIVEAVDTLMGHGLQPGGFAPFSLRFGKGKPDETSQFTLAIEPATNEASQTAIIYSSDTLIWEDEATFSEKGHLIVQGLMTNTSDTILYDPRATITVFDEDQHVIAAGFTDVRVQRLAPGNTAEYHLQIQEMGATPADYIIDIQALPENTD